MCFGDKIARELQLGLYWVAVCKKGIAYEFSVWKSTLSLIVVHSREQWRRQTTLELHLEFILRNLHKHLFRVSSPVQLEILERLQITVR